MLISESYRDLNRELHARGNYGVSGDKWAPSVHALATQCGAQTVLDYGSGQGRLGRALRLMHATRIEYGDDGMPGAFPGLPYEFLEYDPAIAGKETKPREADVVACTDVLEHVEPTCLEAVLDDIAGIARKAVFLVIATRPAKKTLSDGRNAHLIVEPATWWLVRAKLLWRWRPIEFRDMGGEFVFVGSAQ